MPLLLLAQGIKALPFFPERTTPGEQPSIRSMLKKKEKKEADRAMGRCLF
jgi:hypothetical protein